MKIREAFPEDIPVIIKIARATWPIAYKEILSIEQLDFMLDELYDPNILEQQMESGQYFIMSISEKGTATGYASFGKERDSENSYHLDKLYVLPEFQKENYGRALLNYIIRSLSQIGVSSLSLNVNRHNKAKFFYEKMGFTISHSVDIPIGKGFFMNDFIMVKSLQ